MPDTTAAHAPVPQARVSPGTALVHAQSNGVAIDDLHVACVHPRGKARMALYQRALFLDRRPVDIGNHLYRVWITHRNDAHFTLNTRYVEPVRQRALRRIERDALGLEFGNAHVNCYLSVRLELRNDHAGTIPVPDRPRLHDAHKPPLYMGAAPHRMN
jgi:hypothetical protein